MKVFFLFVTVFSAIIYARSNSNRVEDVGPTNDKTNDFLRKMDLILTKMDQHANLLADLSSEERADAQKTLLMLVDFDRTKEERRETFRRLLQEEDMDKEEKIFWETKMNTYYLVFEKIGEKAPISGKMIFTAVAKMINDDRFVFGSSVIRKRIVLEEVKTIVRSALENREMIKEFAKIKNDQEFNSIAKNVFGFEL